MQKNRGASAEGRPRFTKVSRGWPAGPRRFSFGRVIFLGTPARFYAPAPRCRARTAGRPTRLPRRDRPPVPQAWRDRFWRACGAHRHDGRRGRHAARLAFAAALSRSHRSHQPDPRPQLHRDDDARRLRARRVARHARLRRVLYPAGGPPDGHAGLALRHLRQPAGSRAVPCRHQPGRACRYHRGGCGGWAKRP